MAISEETFFLPPDAEGTLQNQIQQLVAEAILSGRFRAGEKMPSSRKLAAHLGVSRITVTLAYTELLADDYLTSRGRSGYYISTNAPQPPKFPIMPREDKVDWVRAIGQKFSGGVTLTKPSDWGSYKYPFIYGQADETLFDRSNWRLCAASGYAAISLTVTTEEVFEQFKDASDHMGYFRDISTFGGCTAGPAAALENMRIIEEENLLENCKARGAQLIANLEALAEKHSIIGDVRGKGLFCGAELVTNRETREPAPEAMVQAVVKDCMAQGVIIGATNRSLPGFNNTLCLSPALICTAEDIDLITDAIDQALTRVFG